MRSDVELRRLAQDYRSGSIFSDRDCETSLLPMVFIPLALMSEDELAELVAKEPWFIYEHLSAAFPRSVNGCPTFGSFRYLTHEEFDRFHEYVHELRDWETGAQPTSTGESKP